MAPESWRVAAISCRDQRLAEDAVQAKLVDGSPVADAVMLVRMFAGAPFALLPDILPDHEPSSLRLPVGEHAVPMPRAQRASSASTSRSRSRVRDASRCRSATWRNRAAAAVAPARSPRSRHRRACTKCM